MAASSANRGSMSVLAPRVRAYFAPVDRASGAPTVFNFARDGMFDLTSPPAPWVDLGWIDRFRRVPETNVTAVRGGAKSAALTQVRAQLEARVEFDFRQWGKLQMALSCGTQHMNVLAPDLVADSSGNTPQSARPVLGGSTASSLLLSVSDLAAFSPGDLVAVDVDYAGQVGYVGTGIAGACVKAAVDVNSDTDYVRRVSFNVARVATLTANSLDLAQPLLGGAPPAGSAVQRIVGFADRDGSSFFQEWSALFVVPEDGGGRLCFHYPRLQAATPANETSQAIADRLQNYSLPASFRALPIVDPIDSEQMLSYRAYFPAASAALY